MGLRNRFRFFQNWFCFGRIMKLSDLDTQTLKELSEALERRFPEHEDKEVLFQEARLTVTVHQGTDFSKFWDILLKNIEDNEVAIQRLLLAAVKLRPEDSNLRNICSLFQLKAQTVAEEKSNM